MVRRRQSPRVRLLLRLTLDPDIDEPLITALANAPKGQRATLVRMWLRGAYATMAATAPVYREGAEDEDSWLDALAVDD